MMRKWSKSMGLFMLAMLLILTACGSNSTNGGKTTNTPKTADNGSVSNTTVDNAKPVELTIMWWGQIQDMKRP